MLVAAAVAVLLSGCANAGDITAKIAPTPRLGASPDADGPQSAMAAPLEPDAGAVAATPQQRGYLDALTAAGVHRSTDLRALSIGSYVCQGHAAGQSPQAVWDFVFPLVRGDIDDLAAAPAEYPSAPRPPLMSASDATAQYIRLATERLC